MNWDVLVLIGVLAMGAVVTIGVLVLFACALSALQDKDR